MATSVFCLIICHLSNWSINFEHLPDECDWVVWIDPPPTECVAHAFEELHATLEKSWLKAHDLERRVMYLTEKNNKLKLNMKKRNEIMQAWGFIIVLGIIILATLVSGGRIIHTKWMLVCNVCSDICRMLQELEITFVGSCYEQCCVSFGNVNP